MTDNALIGKYFYCDRPYRFKGRVGRITSSPTGGWFLAMTMDDNLVPQAQQLVSIQEMKGFLFYDSGPDLKRQLDTWKAELKKNAATAGSVLELAKY